jgi:hypothetical protein
MTRLKELPWWPTIWIAQTGNAAPTATEISKNGALNNVQRLPNGLTLLVDLSGVICKATVSPALSEDALFLLRHILLQYRGQPMAVVEAIDIDFQNVP